MGKVRKSEQAFIEKERPFCFGLCDLICQYVRDFVPVYKIILALKESDCITWSFLTGSSE